MNFRTTTQKLFLQAASLDSYEQHATETG